MHASPQQSLRLRHLQLLLRRLHRQSVQIGHAVLLRVHRIDLLLKDSGYVHRTGPDLLLLPSLASRQLRLLLSRM